MSGTLCCLFVQHDSRHVTAVATAWHISSLQLVFSALYQSFKLNVNWGGDSCEAVTDNSEYQHSVSTMVLLYFNDATKSKCIPVIAVPRDLLKPREAVCTVALYP